MINYFEAAEKTLRARGLLETALGNLERKKERILRYGAPSEYPSADMSKPYTGAKSVNDAARGMPRARRGYAGNPDYPG